MGTISQVIIACENFKHHLTDGGFKRIDAGSSDACITIEARGAVHEDLANLPTSDPRRAGAGFGPGVICHVRKDNRWLAAKPHKPTDNGHHTIGFTSKTCGTEETWIMFRVPGKGGLERYIFLSVYGTWLGENHGDITQNRELGAWQKLVVSTYMPVAGDSTFTMIFETILRVAPAILIAVL